MPPFRANDRLQAMLETKPSHATTAARHQIELPPLRNDIDGTVSSPALDRGASLLDPNTLQILQAQAGSSPEQVERALAASAHAFQTGHWERSSAEERAVVLEQIADALAQPATVERIARADAQTTGAVLRVTRQMAQLAPYAFRGAATHLRSGALSKTLPGKAGKIEYFRRPWGPALLISPWNGPTAIGSHKIASALAAGAPCIYKPSEWAPHSALLMADVLRDSALPSGTFQLVCGNRDIAAPMVGDPRVRAISFTGGVVGGRAIAAASATQFKPLQLELGGNNPLIVFADADLDKAADGIVYGLSNLNAQWCRALGRVLVHHSVKNALLTRVMDRLGRVKLGHSLDESSDMGPLIHQRQYHDVLAAIEALKASGGTVMQNTPLPDLPGYFVPPTLVDGCAPADTCEEVFGPVASVHSFNDTDEALALANGTHYGLAAYVFSEDEEAARAFAREIRCGGVKINGYSLLSLSASAPRGAWGDSGLGEEGTTQSIEFFTGARVVGPSPQDLIGG